MPTTVLRAALAALLVLLTASCASDAGTTATETTAATDEPTPTPEATATATAEPTPTPEATTEAAPTAEPEATTEAAAAVEGEVLVFAASSLTDAFGAIAEDFSATYPDATVTFNFAASSELATQVVEGAPADVLATASGRTMITVVDAGLVEGEPAPFIGNVLAIAVAPGNPMGVTGLADLANPELVVVLAAPDVPAGQYAAEALANAGVTVTPASLEVNVRAVLSRVELGEADAGIVYVSDIVAAGDTVEGVDIPADQNVPATYPIATLVDAPNPDGADAWVEWVLGEEGQADLLEAGFTSV